MLTRQKFESLVKRWYDDTDGASSIHVKMNHPAIREIIDFGTAALPYIKEELQTKRGHWWIPLRDILGDGPIFTEQDRRDMRRVRDKWLLFLSKKGL
jgi:hypothetical protein